MPFLGGHHSGVEKCPWENERCVEYACREDFTITDSTPTIYLVTQEDCINCPAAKAVVEEAFADSVVNIETVDLNAMDPDLEFRLLENQVFIASTPSIIVETSGSLRMLYSGTIPEVEKIRSEVGVN